MSDQSTRATEPQADPRQPFTLDATQAELILAATANGQDFLNQSWSDLGERLGFVWTTVADLVFQDSAGFEMLEPGKYEPVGGATFTAWPIVKVWEPDPDASAWLADMVVEGNADALKNRELILRAWGAGRDTGFAMGSATAQANRPGLGWDGMILIRESAELLRSYEAHHLARVERLVASGARDPDTEAAVDDTRSKARRNAAQAERLESFLADPTQSIYMHDLLREVMEDNRTAALAGWHAAMLQVRELVESGAWWRGETQPSGIPPLVLLDRLGELPPPDDMDEVFERLRNPMLQVERLRVALREWLDKAEWVREAVQAGIPQKLGMPNQLGRHYMDTACDMVGQLNNLLAQAIASTLAGLRVQAAADVLQAIGLADPGAAGQAVHPYGAVRTRSSSGVDLAGRHTQPVPGVYSEHQGAVLEPEETHDGVFPGDADCGGSAAMLGAIHGKEA